MSSVKDYAEIEKTADWSFSSPYKGHIGSLKQNISQIELEFACPFPSNFKEIFTSKIPASANLNAFISPESQDLPLELLG